MYLFLGVDCKRNVRKWTCFHPRYCVMGKRGTSSVLWYLAQSIHYRVRRNPTYIYSRIAKCIQSGRIGSDSNRWKKSFSTRNLFSSRRSSRIRAASFVCTSSSYSCAKCSSMQQFYWLYANRWVEWAGKRSHSEGGSIGRQFPPCFCL